VNVPKSAEMHTSYHRDLAHATHSSILLYQLLDCTVCQATVI